LTLWDQDVDLPESSEIPVGTQLNLVDCYSKLSDYGLDITRGRKEKLKAIIFNIVSL
jgi:hypothetical protein